MAFLVFQLVGPMAAWGEPAPGPHRPGAEHPGWSAIVGMLGAALGLQRDDETAHAGLRDGYASAVAVFSSGRLLRDYHTIQTPPQNVLRGRRPATRRDELSLPRTELATIVSTRDYRQDGAWLVGIAARTGAAASSHSLAELAEALRRPRFALFLGRRACPPSEPLWPQVVDEADDAWDAFAAYLDRRAQRWDAWARERDDARRDSLKRGPTHAVAPRRLPPWPVVPLAQHSKTLAGIRRVAFGDGIEAGVDAALTTVRHDQPLHRGRRQFGERSEHLRVLIDDDRRRLDPDDPADRGPADTTSDATTDTHPPSGP